MNLKTSYKHQKRRENEEFHTPFLSNGRSYPLIRLRSFQKFVSQHIIRKIHKSDLEPCMGDPDKGIEKIIEKLHINGLQDSRYEEHLIR